MDSKTVYDLWIPKQYMIYGLQNSKRGFCTANPFFEAESIACLKRVSAVPQIFPNDIEEDHLVNFAESREERNTYPYSYLYYQL